MSLASPFVDHAREYHSFAYLYPVVSRRSRGLSIGINVNPDKVCNWDCPYCQVDRTTPPRVTSVNDDQVLEELEVVLNDVSSGAIWQHPRLSNTPPTLRRLNDIAFAGDGEPTSYQGLADLIRRVRATLEKTGNDARIIVLTNASLFGHPHVREALTELHRGPADVWCKLDAGTQPYFENVNGTRHKLDNCFENIRWLAKQHPVTIQSMFMRIDGQPPNDGELDAYVSRLRRLFETDAKVRLIQVYTIARNPAAPWCTPLSREEVDRIVTKVRFEVPGYDVMGFYGAA